MIGRNSVTHMTDTNTDEHTYCGRVRRDVAFKTQTAGCVTCRQCYRAMVKKIPNS